MIAEMFDEPLAMSREAVGSLIAVARLLDDRTIAVLPLTAADRAALALLRRGVPILTATRPAPIATTPAAPRLG